MNLADVRMLQACRNPTLAHESFYGHIRQTPPGLRNFERNPPPQAGVIGFQNASFRASANLSDGLESSKPFRSSRRVGSQFGELDLADRTLRLLQRLLVLAQCQHFETHLLCSRMVNENCDHRLQDTEKHGKAVYAFGVRERGNFCASKEGGVNVATTGSAQLPKPVDRNWESLFRERVRMGKSGQSARLGARKSLKVGRPRTASKPANCETLVKLRPSAYRSSLAWRKIGQVIGHWRHENAKKYCIININS